MRRAIEEIRTPGLHIKTAGTTWLEELIGLAEAGGDGLELAKEIYAYAMEHVDELCAPYASVIDIDRKKLPPAATVNGWTSEQFVSALRHDQKNKAFNPSFRQLLHVGFKVAAKKGDRYLNALKKHEAVIAKNVTENLFERHMKPLFVIDCGKNRIMPFIHEDFLLSTKSRAPALPQIRRGRADLRLSLPPFAEGHRGQPPVQKPF